MRSKLLLVIALVGLAGSSGRVHAQQRSADSFIIPGIDFKRISLVPGAWCRYVVIDEALDQIDTTDVYVGIPESINSVYGPAYWVEIATHLRGTGDEGREVMRMLVTEDITRFSEGDSLGGFVLKLYIKSGANPAREEDPKTYEDLSLVSPTSDAAWTTADDVDATTAAGQFVCTKKNRIANNDREFKTGNIKLVKKARDDYSVWFCDGVPVFHLVRCEIDRVRSTETVPHLKGMPAAGEKLSRTAAELVEFGFDAQTLLSIGSLSARDSR